MISYLIGQPKVLDNELILLTKNGVGYQVFTTNTLLSELSNIQDAELYIYTHVKEESLELYGFKNLASKKLFKLLIGVSGIGPKTGLGIIENGPDRVVEAVQQANTAFFSSVPRVGKKSAQKIIIELRSKLGEVNQLDLTPLSKSAREAQDALLALGFDPVAVEAVVTQIDFEAIDLQVGIKSAIKQLGNRT